MEGNKPMNTEKKEFKDWEFSILRWDFGIFFRLSKIRAIARYKVFLKRILLYKCNYFDWDLDGGNQAHENWEKKFEFWGDSLMLALFGIFYRLKEFWSKPRSKLLLELDGGNQA